MINKELFANNPDPSRILNQGVAEVSERDDAESERILRYELETFICEGQYEKGLDKVFSQYLATLSSGKAVQPGVWISGFYGSGKTHLAKMLRVLWTDRTFPDGATARGLVRLPDSVRAHLKDLSGAAERNGGGLFAASGKMGGGGTSSVRLTVFGIVSRAAGFPAQYAQAKFLLWLRDQGKLEAFEGLVRAAGKEPRAELDNLYVSPVIVSAVRSTMPGVYESDTELRQALRVNFAQPTDIGDDELLKTMERLVTKNGKIPLSLLVLDELQQYIGQSQEKAYEVQLVIEACANHFKSRLLVVGTGQSALSDTPNLGRLLGRFPVKVQLSENDVDRVIRRIILAKKPGVEGALKEEIAKRHGEIARHLEGSTLGHGTRDDNDLVTDYPLLPTRRRFWEKVLQTIDPTGTTSQVRNQLRVVNEAVVRIQGERVGHIVGGDFVFDQNAESLVASQAIDREAYTRILELSGGTMDEVLMGRILKLVFLINKLPIEGAADLKLRATASVLADLLVEDLDRDSTDLRRRVPELAEKLVARHALLKLEGDRGPEYRLQTRESSEWMEEYRSQENTLRANASAVDIKRVERLREKLETVTRGLSIKQGESNVDRRPVIRYDSSLPNDYKCSLYIWFRDGKVVTEQAALAEARALDRNAPTVVVFLPDEASNELFNAIIASEAATATLTMKGTPSGPTGEEAMQSILTRLNAADGEISKHLMTIINGARVWLAGGSEVFSGVTLRDLLESALATAVTRLYPRFGDADSKAWDKVYSEAKKGNREALHALGWNGEAGEQPVCKAILTEIGAERLGKDIRDRFEAPPYGWSRDAIDGALFSLLAVDRLSAVDANNHALCYSATSLDRSKIGIVRFRRDDNPIGPGERLKLRGIFQVQGITSASGQEEQAAASYLSAMKTLVTKAGGEAPLPLPPAAPLLIEIEGLMGNDRLRRILAEADRLKELAEGWKRTAEAINQRAPRWELLESLFERGDNAPGLETMRSEREAIVAARSLATPQDPVESLLANLTRILREAINEHVASYGKQFTHLLSQLESEEPWRRLEAAVRQGILDRNGLKPIGNLDVSNAEAIRDRLNERSLEAWDSLIDALPGRFERARKESIQLLEPAIVPVRLPKRIVKTEAELETWLSEVRNLAKNELDKGNPVSV